MRIIVVCDDASRVVGYRSIVADVKVARRFDCIEADWLASMDDA